MTIRGIIFLAGCAALLLSTPAWSEDLVVLGPHGKPNRDVLDLLGDMNSGDFGRAVADDKNTNAIVTHIVDGPNPAFKARYLEFTGNSCGQNGECFALLFYKSYHGYSDLSHYKTLVFDVLVEQPSSKGIAIRIGSWPSRAEVEITDRLPAAGSGWKTIKIEMAEFNKHTYGNFTPVLSEDIFSIGTSGKITMILNNIRWIE